MSGFLLITAAVALTYSKVKGSGFLKELKKHQNIWHNSGIFTQNTERHE